MVCVYVCVCVCCFVELQAGQKAPLDEREDAGKFLQGGSPFKSNLCVIYTDLSCCLEVSVEIAENQKQFQAQKFQRFIQFKFLQSGFAHGFDRFISSSQSSSI